MKNLLRLSLLLGLIPSTNAGVYYYLNYQKSGIKVKCADGKPNHIVELKEGRTIEIKGHGRRKYKHQDMNMELPYGKQGIASNRMHFYRCLKSEEENDVIYKALARCGTNKKFCKGMNQNLRPNALKRLLSLL